MQRIGYHGIKTIKSHSSLEGNRTEGNNELLSFQNLRGHKNLLYSGCAPRLGLHKWENPSYYMLYAKIIAIILAFV